MCRKWSVLLFVLVLILPLLLGCGAAAPGAPAAPPADSAPATEVRPQTALLRLKPRQRVLLPPKLRRLTRQ